MIIQKSTTDEKKKYFPPQIETITFDDNVILKLSVVYEGDGDEGEW